MNEEDRAYLKAAFSDLLNYGADDVTSLVDPLSYRSPEGDSCLHLAALRGDVRAVKLLLELGLDPNASGDMGNTALHHATKRQASDIATLLVAAGAREDALNDFGVRAGGSTAS